MNSSPIKNTIILVMAAGSSRRFGSDKRKAILEDKSVLDTTLEKAKPWKSLIRVILASGDEALQETLLKQGVTSYIAKNAHLGMGHSLADAIQQLTTNEPNISRCLVMLADMPYLKTDTLKKLLDTLVDNDLVVPTYQGKRGNPVGFGKRYFSELKELTGDKGGKIILQRNESSVLEIPVEDSGILRDIDRPEQLKKLLN